MEQTAEIITLLTQIRDEQRRMNELLAEQSRIRSLRQSRREADYRRTFQLPHA